MAKHLRMVPLALIEVDRPPSERSVVELLRHLKAGGSVPPVKLQASCGSMPYLLKDGRHRYLAAMLLGRESILARWSDRR